jgi:hypothetical protein
MEVVGDIDECLEFRICKHLVLSRRRTTAGRSAAVHMCLYN